MIRYDADQIYNPCFDDALRDTTFFTLHSFSGLHSLVKWQAGPLVRYSLSDKNSSSGAFEFSCIACDVVLLDDPCRFEEFAVVERGWGTSRDVDGL